VAKANAMIRYLYFFILKKIFPLIIKIIIIIINSHISTPN